VPPPDYHNPLGIPMINATFSSGKPNNYPTIFGVYNPFMIILGVVYTWDLHGFTALVPSKRAIFIHFP
jgi:hypothetical protein